MCLEGSSLFLLLLSSVTVVLGAVVEGRPWQMVGRCLRRGYYQGYVLLFLFFVRRISTE